MTLNQFGNLLDMLTYATFDDLRDLLDMIAITEDRPGARERRKGISGGYEVVLRTPTAADAWIAYLQLRQPMQRQNAERVIALLFNALRPIEARRRRSKDPITKDKDKRPADERPPIRRGTVQVKTIKGRRYVYIRVWVTAGGTGKLEKRLQSIYIRGSRGLAYALDAASDTDRAALVTRILDAYHAGTLDQLTGQYSYRDPDDEQPGPADPDEQ